MTTTFSIAEAGVRDIADAVAQGELTPTEVLEAVIARIDATEDKIQAWSQLNKDIPRAEAETLTAEAKAGKLRGPLHGVPVAIKEWFNVAGFPTLMKGSGALPESADATVVARLRAAGAIIVGKTFTPMNDKSPPTRNPYNLEHTAGGSSSGSGAVVGARVVPMALAEQTAGSGLRPAAYCGVGGIKATYGVISRYGLYPGSWSKDHPTLIGYTMADMALVLSIIGGYDPLDPTTVAAAAPSADLNMASYGAPKIGIVRNFFPERTSPVMQEAIEKSARTMAEAGALVRDVMLPEEYGLAWNAADMISAEGIVYHAEERANQRVTMGDLAAPRAAVARAGAFRTAELLPATYYLQARRIRTWLAGKVNLMIEKSGVDALLMAVAPDAAPDGIESTGDPVLLTPWSFLGHPTITVNGGTRPDGMPLGLQFVGPSLGDYELMRLGAWAESVLGLLPAPTLV